MWLSQKGAWKRGICLEKKIENGVDMIRRWFFILY